MNPIGVFTMDFLRQPTSIAIAQTPVFTFSFIVGRALQTRHIFRRSF